MEIRGSFLGSFAVMAATILVVVLSWILAVGVYSILTIRNSLLRGKNTDEK